MQKPLLLNYKKAINTLEEALNSPPKNKLERDGMIQRFEYCLEISWKMAKKVMEYQNLHVDTPKNVIRELAKIGWINNPEEWLIFLDSRNKTSHMYHEEIAIELFNLLPNFLISSQTLLKILEEKLK